MGLREDLRIKKVVFAISSTNEIEGKPQEVILNPSVIEAYLGSCRQS